MKRSRFAVRTFARLLLASALLTGLMAVSTVLTMRRLYGDAAGFSLSQAASSLANMAAISTRDTSGSSDEGIGSGATGNLILDTAAATRFCAQAAEGTRLRVTLIGADGAVLGDSRSEPSSMENHAGRPEFVQALQGELATAFRESPTLGLDMAYAAAPVIIDGRIAGALRVAMDAPDLAERLSPLVWMAAIIASLFIAILATFSARMGASVMKPVEALMGAAARWSAGELDTRVPRFTDPDLASLTETMNTMAAELSDRMKAMAQQQGELSAILDGMNEAVIATDADLSIRMVNTKARELLGSRGRRSGTGATESQSTETRKDSRAITGNKTADAGFLGRPLLQTCGSSSLDALARRCIDNHTPQDEEISLYGDTTSTVLAYAAPLVMEDGRLGAILVLNDITRIKRLERVRRDFVANVSHELRTPITLIKGFIETLEDGAIAKPEEAARFMGIIRRHADRMASIVEDLLALARMENPERGCLAMHSCRVMDIIGKAVESLDGRPALKSVSILVDCPPDLEIVANEGLIEQALVNLLDNAVKYGPEGGSVRVKATLDTSDDSVYLSVSDEGQGIPAKDLPRLFERFYRVDRARSRELGGTGLGLAIVRHIAMAHGGTATVRSTEGYGSTFCITLPSAPLSIHSAEPSDETETISS
ncbi:MAG: ATP-binding protein [Spirochaetia bacterium]|nr:ATP-binding protein [Spirochaetia bacterium]